MHAKRKRLDYGGETLPTVGSAAVSFSLLGGGVAWLIHFLAIYAISEFGCRAGWGSWIIGGISMVAWLLLVATALAGALAAAATFSSIRAANVLRSQGGDNSVVSAESKNYIARVSRILNAFFAFIIMVQAIPIFFFLRAC